MRKIVHRTIKHPLISSSAIIIFGSLFGNVFNFLFNLFMSRSLAPADYGTLVSLVSLITLITIPASSISPTVIRFAAEFFAKDQLQQVRGLFFNISKMCLIAGVTVFGVMVLFSGSIAHFFKISDSVLIIFAAFVVLVSFVAIVNVALLQAKLAFTFMTAANTVSFIAKLLLGALLVWLGFSTTGAILAVLVSFLLPYILSFIPLRFLFDKSGVAIKPIRIRNLLSYGAPAAVALFGLNAFVSTDILLVKHFFAPEEAGIYAAGLSLVGRIIFFLTAPVGVVLFPLVVQKHTKGESYNSLLGLAVLLVVVPSLLITTIYFMFPSFAIQLIARQEPYLAASPYLGLYGIFITLYSLLSLLTQFFLSTKKVLVSIPIVLAALSQAVLLWFFHADYFQVIIVSLVCVSTLLFLLLLFYFQMLKQKIVVSQLSEI